ncbi:MAG: lipid-binding SYLF domain-containing protein [bacterium]
MKRVLAVYVWVGLMLVTAGCQSSSSDVKMPSRATQSELNQRAKQALAELYVAMPLSKTLAPKAKAILVFPRVYKAGFIIGGQSGDGVALAPNGTPLGYFNISAASYGLQAGAQGFSYALFVMSDEAIQYMKKSQGWEVGVGPSVVLVDEGIAKTLTTTTGKDDVYAFIFSQKGLMAGIGIQGSKITRINPAAGSSVPVAK